MAIRSPRAAPAATPSKSISAASATAPPGRDLIARLGLVGMASLEPGIFLFVAAMIAGQYIGIRLEQALVR